MKAFWWFKEKSIAGMARPGFNVVHWFDLSFTEALLLGCFGKFPSGVETFASFRQHIIDHGMRIHRFYKIDQATVMPTLDIFSSENQLLAATEKLNDRLHFLKSFAIREGRVYFELSQDCLENEIAFLKNHGIVRIVSLTEQHHQKELLRDHFDLHHISIEDLGAPNLEQVQRLVEIIKLSQKNREALAVHCMAGIGRTSTLLMAAHILLGEKASDLEALLKKQNPTFTMAGSQGEFLRSLANR